MLFLSKNIDPSSSATNTIAYPQAKSTDGSTSRNVRPDQSSKQEILSTKLHR